MLFDLYWVSVVLSRSSCIISIILPIVMVSSIVSSMFSSMVSSMVSSIATIRQSILKVIRVHCWSKVFPLHMRIPILICERCWGKIESYSVASDHTMSRVNIWSWQSIQIIVECLGVILPCLVDDSFASWPAGCNGSNYFYSRTFSIIVTLSTTSKTLSLKLCSRSFENRDFGCLLFISERPYSLKALQETQGGTVEVVVKVWVILDSRRSPTDMVEYRIFMIPLTRIVTLMWIALS